jgi:hypothetical protein
LNPRGIADVTPAFSSAPQNPLTCEPIVRRERQSAHRPELPDSSRSSGQSRLKLSAKDLYSTHAQLRGQDLIALCDDVVRNPVEFMWIQLRDLLILDMKRLVDILFDNIVLMIIFADNTK